MASRSQFGCRFNRWVPFAPSYATLNCVDQKGARLAVLILINSLRSTFGNTAIVQQRFGDDLAGLVFLAGVS